MALKSIAWLWRTDIHVLRGQKRRLDQWLFFMFDAGNPKPASDTPRPADVTAVTFTPIFNFTLATHGHKVDPATGEVEVAAALPGGATPVPNFIVRASVTHTSPQAPVPLMLPIRVHIHRQVTNVWLTPDPLTVRIGAKQMRFSVLAQFDDQTVGDISKHPGLIWSVAGAGLAVDAQGILTASVAGNEPTVTVTLPADLGGSSASAKVRTAAAWPNGLVVRLVPGSPGSARRNEIPNVIFLAEGFQTGEKTKFETVVDKLVGEIASATTTYPFNILRPNMNYWSVFLVSRERAACVLNGLRYVSRTGGDKRMKALPVPVDPGTGAAIQSLEHLLYRVGLPVPADAGATFATRSAAWTALYGAAHVNGLTEPLFKQWRDLNDYTLAFERDTALGLRNGLDRPQVELVTDDGRTLWWHAFRTSRADLKAMIASMVSSDSGDVIGPLWDGGKDQQLVFALAAGPHRSGAAPKPPEALIAASMIEEAEVKVQSVAGSKAVRTTPYSIPGTLSAEVRTLVIHETAHTIHLGDEYGDGNNINLADPTRVDGYFNLCTEAKVLDPGSAIDGKLVPWNWPRISKVAVFTRKPTDLGSKKFRFFVGGGQAAAFNPTELVKLRRRPLGGAPPPTGPFKIESLAGGAVEDEVDVLHTGLAFPPVDVDDFPAGTLMYLPTLHPTAGTELTLMWDGVRDFLTLGTPLNRTAVACARDDSMVQSAINWPPAMPPNKPPYTAWLIGIYDGGAEFHCGAFHPAGACLMRKLRIPRWSAKYPGSPYRFCAVCRYILTDVLDPLLHPLVDAEYDKFYPIP